MRNLLLVHQTTAWIAPNDYYLQKIHVWTRHVGLRVPDDISLISFDNSAESYTFPLASVDPGFAHLGFLAAHAIIGDIAVPSDRHGNIPGRCRLVDRGSLGPPRKSKETIEALTARLGGSTVARS